jgi:hypothetical protein
MQVLSLVAVSAWFPKETLSLVQSLVKIKKEGLGMLVNTARYTATVSQVNEDLAIFAPR